MSVLQFIAIYSLKENKMKSITQSQYYYIMALYTASIIGMFTAFTLNGLVFIFALFSLLVFPNPHIRKQLNNIIYKNIIVTSFVALPILVSVYRMKEGFLHFYYTGNLPFHNLSIMSIGAVIVLAIACSFVVLICKITLVFDLMKFSDDDKSQF